MNILDTINYRDILRARLSENDKRPHLKDSYLTRLNMDFYKQDMEVRNHFKAIAAENRAIAQSKAQIIEDLLEDSRDMAHWEVYEILEESGISRKEFHTAYDKEFS